MNGIVESFTSFLLVWGQGQGVRIEKEISRRWPIRRCQRALHQFLLVKILLNTTPLPTPELRHLDTLDAFLQLAGHYLSVLYFL